MENRRLVVTIFITVFLIFVLFLSNSYSIFTSENADPNTNVYTTGNLDITYEVDDNNIKFTDSKPISEKDVISVSPYRLKVTNTGNVDYKFNILLKDTTATSVINYKYIMVKVGKYDSISLDSTHDNVIREGIIVKANSSVIVDVKIYISDKISNSEVGKNFSAKLSISGIAIASSEDSIDNSKLLSEYQLLSKVDVGSYVVLSNSNISANNANYVSNDDMGYCFNVNNKYRFNGYRLLYVKDNTPYIVSSGASYCFDNPNNDNISGIIESLNDNLSNYCEVNYIYDGKCDDNIHLFNSDDFKLVINNDISNCDNNHDLYCGYGEDLINNGGYYWITSNNNLKGYYWDPVNGYVNNTNMFNMGYGLRVVLKLNNNVYIERGLGTYSDPYVLKI